MGTQHVTWLPALRTILFVFLNLAAALLLGPNPAQGSSEAVNLIHIKGSNAMVDVVQAWTKIYHANNPGVFFEVDGGGSGNGIAALINGHVDIAVTTRNLKEREIRLISQRSGKLPKTHIIGMDALSIVVHKSNPLNGLTMNQLTRVFGNSGGYSRWSDLGVEVPGCDNNTIQRISRKNNSGDYFYFRETVLKEHNHFHANLITIRQPEKLMEKVALSPCAIAFTSMATVTNDVKTVCVARDDAQETACVPPTADFTHKGLYPLARPLFFLVLDSRVSLAQPFIDWVQGSQGQEIIRKAGFIALQDSLKTDPLVQNNPITPPL
ncbi:MAG: phosphate ABC transporter substrate-binding protein [Magnetococcales bacterium]|nr:phosphate ABC transporter substrate-binding protein [Magnetococcales bacterium]